MGRNKKNGKNGGRNEKMTGEQKKPY